MENKKPEKEATISRGLEELPSQLSFLWMRESTIAMNVSDDIQNNAIAMLLDRHFQYIYFLELAVC